MHRAMTNTAFQWTAINTRSASEYGRPVGHVYSFGSNAMDRCGGYVCFNLPFVHYLLFVQTGCEWSWKRHGIKARIADVKRLRLNMYYLYRLIVTDCGKGMES